MKFSESWLYEWVNPKLSGKALCDLLTMSGLEVEERVPAAGLFNSVIVGEVLSVEKHPQADRLNVCSVNVGQTAPLQIVCGAANVRKGMKAPVAMVNAQLSEMTITASAIRGVQSFGMLCSAKELGLAEESEGLLALAEDAPLGHDVRKYLLLDDHIIDVSITPNRGDCLSIRGLARDVAALTGAAVTSPELTEVKAAIKDKLPIKVSASEACPRYLGRIIRGVKADASTPVWMKERLRRGGIRSIHPIVDITNYVMLELGQPMHAFDLSQIGQEIQVRISRVGEKIALLDGSEKTLDDQTLVIADASKPLAIAGVMGGLDSSVTLLTRDIFLESAYFSPQTIARQRQFYQLNSESAYRFERGVDPDLQRLAIERATALILSIAGGEAGSILDLTHQAALPQAKRITLSNAKLTQVLGMVIPEDRVEVIFQSLGFGVSRQQQGWQVEVPAYRFDISLPEDLIEEAARLYGYDHVPARLMKLDAQVPVEGDNARLYAAIRHVLANQGFHEIISYSFIDEKRHRQMDPDQPARRLLNPISADMAIMRTSLWPGLIETLCYNKSRQQQRIRLFEIGTVFRTQDGQLTQPSRVSGLIAGYSQPEQWGLPAREADFYDLKGVMEILMQTLYPDKVVTCQPDRHAALHPGQTAGIYLDVQKIGLMGALHPTVLQALDIAGKGYLFELDLDHFPVVSLPVIREVSRFPEIRRDIAILVDQAIPSRIIQDTIKSVAGDWLKDSFIFDVYQGKGIPPGLKSIALALVLQHPARTLVDDEVTVMMERIVTTLKEQLGAELRS